MKCYTVVVIALAVLGAHAQSWNDIPACVQECLHVNGNKCESDFACICRSLGPFNDANGQFSARYCTRQSCRNPVVESMTPRLYIIKARTQADLIHRRSLGRRA